jgi:hypothetical protein
MQKVHQQLFSKVKGDIPFTFLRYLDLSYNKIKSLPLHTYISCPKLTTLKLKGNQLQVIQKGFLLGLDVLHTLDLSDNTIENIHAEVFDDTPVLQTLFIENNQLKSLSREQLPPWYSLTVLKSDLAVLCCVYSYTCHCSPKPTTQASCTHMLSLKGLAVIIPLQGITVVTINLMAIVWNIRHPTVESAQWLNLNIADLLMGLYLGLVESGHLVYRNRFMDVILVWKHHWLCLLIATLAFMSSESSLFTSLFMLLQRTYNLTREFKQVEKSSNYVTIYIIMWVACIAICVPLVYPFNQQAHSTINLGSNLCLALNPFSVDTTVKWVIMLCLTILHILVLAVIFGCYVILPKVLWHSLYGSLGQNSRKTTSLVGFIKIFISVMSTLFTYVPQLTLHILALCECNFHQNAAIWIIIVCIPMTSMMNPFVNTIQMWPQF